MLNMEDEQKFINVKGLCKNYGRKKVLDEVSFGIQKGKITGFLGPNGAGKTTTIKCLLGLISKNSGIIEVNGEHIRDLQDLKFKIRVGAMLEFHSFYANLTAVENLDLLSLCDKAGIDNKKIDQILNLMDLKNNRNLKVKTFSFGMKQKLAAASAFLNEPDVLILDEPFTGLDPNAMDRLSGILREYSDNNGTVFVSSHILGVVEDICDYLIVINNGKIIRQGELKDFASDKSLKRFYLDVTGDTNG